MLEIKNNSSIEIRKTKHIKNVSCIVEENMEEKIKIKGVEPHSEFIYS